MRWHRTRSLAGFGLVLLALWCLSGGVVRGDGPGQYAVIVGINDYADPAIPDLKYAESDARAMYDTLTDPAIGRFPKGNVTLILGKEATPSKIKAALYKLRGVDKEDLVIVFYSGHGAKEGEEAFWVTQNAEKAALPVTSLTNSDILKRLAQIPSQRLVVLLDCCYAASTVKKSLEDPGKLFGEFAGKGRVTIAGSADKQEALEYEDKKSGVFSYFLVHGLRGAADSNTDGVVTFDEIWAYLGRNVRKASVKQGGLHEPVIITKDGVTPQFLLTLNPAVQELAKGAVAGLRKLFTDNKIKGTHFDVGRAALTTPALDDRAKERRQIFADLVAGKLQPRYLDGLLRELEDKAAQEVPPPPPPTAGKPALAVVPFEVYGHVPVRDAGRILADQLLGWFDDTHTLVDYTQLKHFVAQDRLTMAGLVQELATRGRTKSLTKAVKLRAVRHFVTGTISGSPDGSLMVTAKFVDWQTGTIQGNRVAQIGAQDWASLLKRLPGLAAQLRPGYTPPVAPGPGQLPPIPGKLFARIDYLQEIERKLQELLQDKTEQHPEVKQHRSTLASLGATLMREVKSKVLELQQKDREFQQYFKGSSSERKEIADQLARLNQAVQGILFRTTQTRYVKIPGTASALNTVQIPAGGFLMGAADHDTDAGREEKPQVRVTISRAFYMAQYEVTQEQYQAVMGTNPSEFKSARTSDRNPVHRVSWTHAVEFCKKLSQLTGKTFRLPTEAEWEYACRAGSASIYATGDSTADLKVIGLCSEGWGKTSRPQQVGGLKPNRWGLYDMHGNVAEWCADWFAEKYYRSSDGKDPKGPATGTHRVVRGGSWYTPASYCRSSRRDSYRDFYKDSKTGFRVVMEEDQ